MYGKAQVFKGCEYLGTGFQSFDLIFQEVF